MKIRSGFVSNSSSTSFVVKTRPSKWDVTLKEMGMEDVDSFTLSVDKVDLLKSVGFFSCQSENPFFMKKGSHDEEKNVVLGFSINCNQDFVMELLVANDIPFKASVHYGHYLYSYEQGDDYIYVLSNFGMEYVSRPKELEEILSEDNDYDKMFTAPLRRISKKDYLKNYDEKSSLQIMKEG